MCMASMNCVKALIVLNDLNIFNSNWLDFFSDMKNTQVKKNFCVGIFLIEVKDSIYKIREGWTNPTTLNFRTNMENKGTTSFKLVQKQRTFLELFLQPPRRVKIINLIYSALQITHFSLSCGTVGHLLDLRLKK